MITEIFLPRLGETMEEGKIIRWIKIKGEKVKKGDIVCEVETDKSVFEIQAEGDGVITEIFINEEETIPVGTILGYIAASGEKIPEELLNKNK